MSSPADEAVIASRTTAVAFNGWWPSTPGPEDDADTAQLPFRVWAQSASNSQFYAISGIKNPNQTGYVYGDAGWEWHQVSFGNLVIPSWAWKYEGGRWHARVRISHSSTAIDSGYAILMAYTDAEQDCYQNAIKAGQTPGEPVHECGGETEADVYANQ